MKKLNVVTTKQKQFVLNNKDSVRQYAVQLAAGVASTLAVSMVTIIFNRDTSKTYDIKEFSKKNGRLVIEEENRTTIGRDIIHPAREEDFEED